MTKVIGKINWDEGDVGGSDFVSLEEGSNAVRCISSPYQHYIAFVTDTSGKSRKLRSAVKDCPLVQRGEKIQARWYVGVLSRKTGKPGIMEIGPQIFKQIVALSKKPKWGDPRAYDIDVVRQPKGSQPLYVVSPEPKEPLSDEEQVLVKEFLKRVDLAKMTEAPTPDEVLEKLGEMGTPMTNKTTATVSHAVSNNTDDGSDDDFDFGDS